MSSSNTWTTVAMALVAATVVSACGGGSGETPVPAGGAPIAEAGEGQGGGDVPGTGVEGGPDFDLSGITVTATTSPPGPVNIGTFWAYQRLREWGADVETVIITTTTGVQTLIAGRADLASQGSDEVVLGAAEGADMVAIGAPSTRMDYVLVARSDIETVEDLAGQSVAISGPAGFDALLSRFSLRDAGVDTGDVNFVQVGGSPDRATALLSGQTDAATVFLEDWEELSRQTDDLRLVQYMADIVPDFPATAYFAERSYWEDNPEVALALACANLQANAWTNEDKDRWVDYVLEVVEGATEEGTSALYDSAQEIEMWPTDPSDLYSVDGMGGLVDAMLETGDISDPVDPEEVSDVSFLLEAAEMGCGQP